MKTIFLAGGCFWGMEKYFSLVKGVVNTEVGYANGEIDNPTYEHLKSHRDSAAETLKIQYDDNLISLEKILELYLRIIDPYSLDKQGEDEGHQYRTGIYYLDINEDKIIKQYLSNHIIGKHVIEVCPLSRYFKAESYHQNYLVNNPKGYCHIDINKLNNSEKK